MEQRSAEDWLVSVPICNSCLFVEFVFCSFHLVRGSLMHSFVSFNLDSF